MHAFEDSTDYKTLNQRLVGVGLNEYAILTADSPAEGILTCYTNVCAGIAVIAEDGSPTGGLMHVFSDPMHYRHGRAIITASTQKAWDHFSSHLPYGRRYHAVTFGGHRPSGQRAPAPASVREYFNIFGSFAHYLENKGPEAAHGLSQQDSEREEYLHYMGQDHHLRARYEAYHHRASTLNLRAEMGLRASFWTNEALYNAAVKSGFITIEADLRFKNAPHDALVLPAQNQIRVRHSSVLENRSGPYRRTYEDARAKPLFCGRQFKSE